MHKKCLILSAAAIMTVSCATQPFDNSVNPGIQVITEDMTPKWNELSREIVPKRINRKVRASLASSDNLSAPRYKMTLKFVNNTKEVTGSKGSSAGIASVQSTTGIAGGSSKTKIKTKTTVEAIAVMRDAKNSVVWEWSGYGEDEDDDNAVEKVADKIAASLATKGFLDVAAYK